MWLLTYNVLVLGGFIFVLFWYAWFHDREKHPENQQILLFGFMATMAGLLAARTLALTLPFRERPFHNDLIHFKIPYGTNPSALMGWSSFPSDHAVVFFCLATTLWFVSRWLGVIAFLHAIFVVALPRIYCGIHYPTDILAGAVLGIGFACLGKITALRQAATRPILTRMDSHADVFYGAFFFCTFELAELFNSVRKVLSYGLHIVK